MAKLTVRQKKLVEGIVSGLTHKKAYLNAGYSNRAKDNTITTEVNKTLKKPLVKQYLEKLQKEVNEKAENNAIASAIEIQEFLTQVVRGEIKETVTTATGVFAVEVKPQSRIKAAELLGKTYKLFTDKVELDADMNISIEVDYGE